MSQPVRVVEYDPRWPSMFEEARAEILECAGGVVLAVEHVGSTSVPGLGAKPIIDIAAGIRRLEDARHLIEPLARFGYEYVPKPEQEAAQGRKFFRKGRRGAGTHHLHVAEFGGEEWRRKLLFRDYLRAHAGAAREYEKLKRELAAAHVSDRGAYNEAKADFIESVIEKARALEVGEGKSDE